MRGGMKLCSLPLIAYGVLAVGSEGGSISCNVLGGFGVTEGVSVGLAAGVSGMACYAYNVHRVNCPCIRF